MPRARNPHSFCKSCGKPVMWVKMDSGKPMPLDPTPTPLGNICAMLDRDTGEHVGWYSRDVDKAQRYKSHFATCPHAEKHRKGLAQGRLFG